MLLTNLLTNQLKFNYKLPKKIKQRDTGGNTLAKRKDHIWPFPGAVDRGKYLDAMTTHKLPDEHTLTS